jgi:hypothetical protein
MLIKNYIPYLILLLGQMAVVSSAQDSISNNSVIACSVDKLNVFYIGIDNPITIAVSNTPPDKVTVLGLNCVVTPRGNGKYIVTVLTPGTARIQVSGNGNTQTFYFRVKLMPNPVPTLSHKKGGTMGQGEFCAQAGIIPVMEGFDFDMKCAVQSFTVTRISRNENPVSLFVLGGAFDANAQRLICAAQAGDIYQFSNIKTRCPGDNVARDVGTMLFTIK